MSVGGILQNSLSQPSHYLDMKLHRWGFISPGSRCLLMIIQVAGNLHAVTLLTIFFFFFLLRSSLHLLDIICRRFSLSLSLTLIPNMKAVEVKFFRYVPWQPSPPPTPLYHRHSKWESWGGQAGRCVSVLSNQWYLMRGDPLYSASLRSLTRGHASWIGF